MAEHLCYIAFYTKLIGRKSLSKKHLDDDRQKERAVGKLSLSLRPVDFKWLNECADHHSQASAVSRKLLSKAKWGFDGGLLPKYPGGTFEEENI